MCDRRHYHQHQLRHRHCDNGEVLIKGLLVIIFASLRGKSSSLEAKLFFFFLQNKARHVSHLSCLFDFFLSNLPIVFNIIHGRVHFSTSALSVGRKNSIHVLFSPNVAWH